jgi:hypothetical protein
MSESSLKFLKITGKPLFDIVNDPDPTLGRTLRAKRHIPKSTPVVIYYGETKTIDDNLSEYFDDPKKYIEEQGPYIRGHPIKKDISIDATKIVYENFSKTPSNLVGVLVNDIAKPKSLKIEDLKEYLNTSSRCNLETIPTSDYPLYVAKRKIKKGEILTVHYGLGYWLLHMGVPPEKISHYISYVNRQ